MRIKILRIITRFIGISAVFLTTIVAEAQNLFVADTSNIYEITPDGAQSTFASGLVHPQGMAFDSKGDLFVDSNGTIDEFAPDGTESVLGTETGDEGLAFDPFGNLFAAGFGGDIVELTNGVSSVYASGFNEPVDLVFDSADDLFVSSVAGGAPGVGYITKVTTNGVQSLFASGLSQPRGMVFDSEDDLLVAVGTNVYEYTTNGVQSTYATFTNGVNDLAFDNAGNLYATEPGINGVVKVAPDGIQSIFATGFNNPVPLAFQPSPTLNISLSGTNIILSWSAYAFGFTLRWTTNLNPPTVWCTNSSAPIVVNGLNTVTNSSTCSQQFFRLIQ